VSTSSSSESEEEEEEEEDKAMMSRTTFSTTMRQSKSLSSIPKEVITRSVETSIEENNTTSTTSTTIQSPSTKTKEGVLDHFNMYKPYKRKEQVYSKLDTKLPADCVEVGPRLRSGNVVLASGTYLLDESTKVKSGHIGLYTVSVKSKSLVRLKTYGKSAIFNMRWCGNRLGAVTADSQFRLYRLREREKDEEPSLEHLGSETSSKKSKQSGVHYTSLDWNPYEKQKVCVSHSNGNLSTWCTDRDEVKCVHEWRAHTYEGDTGAEVWSVSYYDSNVVLSGSDDMKLKTWDLRDRTVGLICKGHHEMGVTAIRTLKGAPNTIVTGSYDEMIRIFDIRSLRKGPVSSISCGGGVWQIRTAATQNAVENRMIAACMRGGVSVVSVSSDRGLVLESSSPFDKELMYGVTCVNSTGDDSDLYASCSFYEHTLYLFS